MVAKKNKIYKKMKSLLNRNNSLHREIKKTQETQDIADNLLNISKVEDIWIISDSSSNFASLDIKNGKLE